MGKFCSNCGKELQGDERFCQNCGAETGNVQNINENNISNQVQNTTIQKPKKKKSGCLIFIIAIFIFFGLIAVALLGTIGQNAAIQKEISGVSDSSEYITMEEYNKIQTGMSYEEVKEIVGSSGEVTAQSGGNGIEIVMVSWYGNGVAGSNANVTFTNNEVTAKAQVGLQ